MSGDHNMHCSANTGGPAFPTPSGWDSQGNWCRNYTDNEGISMRDYFAGKALKTYSDDTDEMMLENAIKAYKQADAMLKARQA